MAVSPNDLLEMARRLLSGNEEIDFRTAANRAYYSSYHFCKPLADSLPRTRSRKRGSHERLIERLKTLRIRNASRTRDKKFRAFGYFLNIGKPLRVEADYRIDTVFGRAKAEQLILTATKIRDVISELGIT